MKFPISHTAVFLSSKTESILKSLSSNEINHLLSLSIQKLSKVLPKSTVFFNSWPFAIQPNNFDFLNIQILKYSSEIEFLKKVSEKLPKSRTGDPDWDDASFFYFTGLFPCLDESLSLELYQRHDRYLSQYSYSENLPPGIVPTILSREFTNAIPESIQTSAQDYLLKNINHYDVEIFYHSPDLRQYRLDFSLKNKRSLNLVRGFLKSKEEWSYSEIHPWIEKNPEVFRTGPSYLELEVFRGCDLSCSFCPRQFNSNDQDGKFLSPEFLESLLRQQEESFSNEYTVCFGGLGEPLLHPNFKELILTALKSSSHLMQELMIETAFYTDPNIILDFLNILDFAHKEKITWIINLTTRNPEKYATLYGKNKLEKVLSNIKELEKVFPKNRIYLQFLKIQEAEDEVESWVDETEKQGYGVILQKYNRYAGLMPEKRVTDLTPIQREFCWHLNRDLYVNSDGSVSICKQVPEKTFGNLHKESLIDIWRKGLPAFKDSLNSKHETTGAPCINCDEWYTFNA
ncbi:spiro-SPASM protein [Leptospira interrogans]|uniref:spiro-SPASM protein n=1 Tax=Leptospira interrogans TaxID=173 RepID=UPI0002BC31BF|nr:spiro-SPASM protein [Leptospira interrogans]MCR8647031.1 spiro-SPASM protein [Leptospira interrogans serovar Bataviae]OAM86249.1 spiro-SPASM protein [Leptospira interrogans serovar Bataviae]QOI39648.1 spiro-SPASM protein [Leptospira interrogans serovar Bataviae]QYY59909.1 spiro-SPASM protein [Leptospira interrogans serovar Bataviae]